MTCRGPAQVGTSSYFGASSFVGAVVGRVANRVANSSFELDGLTYYVSANENSTASLHGGKMGFSTRMWEGQSFTNDSGSGVTLTLHSADRDQAS